MTRRSGFITNRFGLTSVGAAVSSGSSRRALQRAAEGGRMSRVYRGTYAAPDASADHGDLRAAIEHLGPEAVAVIGSAALVQGLAGLPAAWTPQVALPPGLERRQRPRLDLHIWDLPAGHVEPVDGIPVTTLIRTLADVCRILPTVWAVGLVDSALNQGRLAPEQFPQIEELMARRRNCVAGRRNLGLARSGSQSPGETRVRLLASAAGLPPDRLQLPIVDDRGRPFAYADMAYELPGGGWLLVEFDGRSVHEQPDALLGDRRRQNALLAIPGVTVVRFAWEDTYADDSVGAALRPTLVRAGWRPGVSTATECRA